jgi:hypothetical protein
MERVTPHQFFRIDFDQILDEARRQERIHPLNEGEYAIVRRMHGYFDGDVLPLVVSNDWVFEAAKRFVLDFTQACFDFLKLTGKEIHGIQKNLGLVNEQITDFLARAHIAGAAPQAGEVALSKASDFVGLILLDKLPAEMQREVGPLRWLAHDHEVLQLKATLRGIRDAYETPLPRVMYVVRRAMKSKLGLPHRAADDDLTSISEYVSWYARYLSGEHALSPVLGELASFYKTARNDASHHQGLEWKPETGEVLLRDRDTVLAVPFHVFQQRYRYLIYICELGLRGILSAFCERERGLRSNLLVVEYLKTFPDGFPAGEPGEVAFYPLVF